MAQWGASNLPIIANSSTTEETTNGAIIGVGSRVDWGKDNTSIVISAANVNFGNTSPGSKTLVDLELFQNTTVNAYITNIAVGLWGISANETANAFMGAHAGWTLVTQGTGGRAGRIQTETLVAMHSLGDYTAPNLLVGTDTLVVSTNNDTISTPF
jgi:hypothetical protein